MTPLGQMQWFADGSWLEQNLSEHDQIIIDEGQFGVSTQRSLRLMGCSPITGVKIRSKRRLQTENLETYLVQCSDDVKMTIPARISPVRYDLTQGYLESDSYFYKYKPKNHMLFESVRIKAKDGTQFEIAKDADLLIRADIKNFFNMQFDSSDIESKMKFSRSEKVGAFATIGFYLNILFFKVSMDLDTDVRFFSSSAHIPMILTTPVDARKNLNPKSGVLYSFVLGDQVQELSQIEMPRLSDTVSKQELTSKHCQDFRCVFSLKVERASPDATTFSLELNLPLKLVELGMFPQFVSDVGDVAKDMGWALDKRQRGQKRVGLYLEVSGLPKGEQPWDLWMDFKQK
jgi:hypothetical protein